MSDIESIRKRAEETREYLNKAVQVIDGYIVINVAYEYDIPIKECGTAERILGWVLQLSEKTWMTMEVLNRFVHVAAREAGVKIVR